MNFYPRWCQDQHLLGQKRADAVRISSWLLLKSNFLSPLISRGRYAYLQTSTRVMKLW